MYKMKTTRSATWARALAAAAAARTVAPPRHGLVSGRAGSTRAPGGSAGGSLGWISQPQAWLNLLPPLPQLELKSHAPRAAAACYAIARRNDKHRHERGDIQAGPTNPE